MDFKRILSGALSVVVCIAVFAFIGVVASASIDCSQATPDHAMVLISEDEKTYFSPPLMVSDSRDYLVTYYWKDCKDRFKPASAEVALFNPKDDAFVFVDLRQQCYFVLPQNNRKTLSIGTRGAAVQEGFKPDREHVNASGFMDHYSLLEAPFHKSRWTEDGNWRY